MHELLFIILSKKQVF